MELDALQNVVSEIEKLGANLIAISPQREEFLRQMAEKNNLTFEILSDKGNEIAHKFGLRFAFPDYLREVYQGFGADLARFNGDDSWTLPMPARYVVNRDGIIVAADFDPDYTHRPEPSKTVEDLRNKENKK